VPIVTTGTNDPVRIGLIESLARPGGNVTGVSSLGETISTKWLELLHQVTPGLKRVSTLWNPDNPGSVLAWEGMQVAAQQNDTELQSVTPRRPTDIDAALAEVAGWQPHGVVLSAIEPMVTARYQIAACAVQQHLATVTLTREFVEAGCLMSYGANPYESTRRGAYYVDRILRGANPAELPVEQPRVYEFAVTATTAQALDITLPPTLAHQVSAWLS
jgi:putative ABC transport system substrate-binding protein